MGTVRDAEAVAEEELIVAFGAVVVEDFGTCADRVVDGDAEAARGEGPIDVGFEAVVGGVLDGKEDGEVEVFRGSAGHVEQDGLSFALWGGFVGGPVFGLLGGDGAGGEGAGREDGDGPAE